MRKPMSLPPEALHLDRQVCFPLYAATRAMTKLYQPHLAKLGLTYPQYLVLLALWQHDELSVGALGEKLYLDSGTLTPLLKRLEAAGSIDRVRSRDDERVVVARLTAKGRKLRERARGIPEALFGKLGMKPEEFVRLRNDLRDLYTRLRALAEDTGKESS